MDKPKRITCPVCEESFELEPDLEVGDTTSCPGCYVDLEILRFNPVKVKEVESFIGKDDDEDEDFDEKDGY